MTQSANQKTRYIYLDTNFWNGLCDEEANAEELLASLRSKGLSLVVSHTTLYELGKTFMAGTEKLRQRGIHLFSHLKTFTDLHVFYIKNNMELLAAEMWRLKLKSTTIEQFGNDSDQAVIRALVNKLADGIYDQQIDEDLKRHRVIAEQARIKQVEFFNTNPEVARVLQTVGRTSLLRWLDEEMRSHACVSYLAWQIRDYFPESPVHESLEYAFELLRSPTNRVARSLVRRNLHFNWQCAQSGTVKQDFFDDGNHIINANYCDVYVTGDGRQEAYASLLLRPSTRVAIYKGDIPPSEWLLTTL